MAQHLTFFAWAFWLGPTEPVSAAGFDWASLASAERPVWVHLDWTDKTMRAALEQAPFFNENLRAALLDPVDHQFIEHADDELTGVVLDFEARLDGAGEGADFLRFALTERMLITARMRPLQSARGTRTALEAGAQAAHARDIFEMLVDSLADEAARRLQRLSRACETIEDKLVLEGAARAQRRPFGLVRREAQRLARQVAGFHATLARLEEAAQAAEHEALAEISARLSQRSEALMRDCNGLLDRARGLQEEMNAALTLETNDRLYVLTVLTAVLLPATLVTGYFGMNTRQLLFFENDYGTLYATLLCCLASGSVIWFLRRRGFSDFGGD
jgi:Mg2+ and Co2+ transporter CorA